jgi:ketosteroid isomerase-like protein
MNENVEVLEQGYRALSRGDLDEALGPLDPELEWRPGEVAPEGGDVHHGADGFRRFIESWRESFDDFHLDPELFLASHDRIVAVMRQRGRGRGSGVAMDVRVVHVWTIRDDRAVGWWGAGSIEEALEEVGDERLPIALRGYEAFNSGDLDAAIELFDDEVVWHTWIVPGPGGGTYHGHDGVRELWSDARNVFGDFRNEPERLIAADDHVVAFIRVYGKGKESGAEVEARIAHLLTFRGDKVLRVDSYEDHDQALKAAGLEG